MGPLVCSLLSACVVVFVIHLAPVQAQCDGNVLTAMLSRLQHTVDRLQDTVEQLRKDHKRSTEQLLVKLDEALGKRTEYGQWSQWADWSTCSVICGGGRQQRTRRCNPLVPKDGGANCNGNHTESRTCNNDACLVGHDCADLLKKGYRQSGVYDVYVADKKFKVFCHMKSNEGWLVIQRRQDGSVEFNRDWNTYKEGFGNLTGEFWLGNDYLHAITSQANYTLRVDLTDFNGSTRYAEYTTFAIASERENYTVSVRGYRGGTAGHAMYENDGMAFSTEGRDNDKWLYNCAQSFQGGWWYKWCGMTYLNGVYRHDGSRVSVAGRCISWATWHGYYTPLKSTEMKIKPN